MNRDTKFSGNRSNNGERAIVDLLKSSGYLFPDTDEQMSVYEANVTFRELPEKFGTPEFVFNTTNKNNNNHKNRL